LVADDQPYVIDAVRLLLKTEGWQVRAAGSPSELVAALESGEEFDVVLMDLIYAGDTTSGEVGLVLLRHLQQLDPALPIVVMTAWGSVERGVEARRRGARVYVV
jgi:DNA-binding NtrC family response regulator